MEFKYLGVRTKQTEEGNWLVQFSAPASEIELWAGVPQKKRFLLDDDVAGESVGFQRGEDAARVRSLGKFLDTPENVVQNPLLCSLRNDLKFVPSDAVDGGTNVEVGELVIEVPEFESYSVEECLKGVREYLERRQPELASQEPEPEYIKVLKGRLADPIYMESQQFGEIGEEYEAEDDVAEEDEARDDEDYGTTALYEDSHIGEFWHEIAARHEIARETHPDFDDRQEFLGFNRDALLSYLRPIVLVDGQHRLRGALAAAEAKLNDESLRDEVEERVGNGESAEAIEVDIKRRESRLLPISLLMSTDAEEQVFQFVVVNQKATPIGRALLGTIISTTLSTDELDKVSKRLMNAGIPLEESRAVTFMATLKESPFFERVDRGLSMGIGAQQEGLQWNVLASLIAIFRDLAGGRLFGQRADYASAWRVKYLDESPIVEEYAEKGFGNAFEYWQDFYGPWQQVFLVFWKTIKDRFGSESIEKLHSYWGRPRKSNLYNKISLIILAADFFQFLVETRTKLESADDVEKLVDIWLENVNSGYFDRDWQLEGIKKDVPGIRNQWAEIWTTYRKVGEKLPPVTRYRQNLKM